MIWFDAYSYPEDVIVHNKASLLWVDALSTHQRDWPEYQFPAPLQCVVQKWLRELHDLHINIRGFLKDGTVHWEFTIQELQNFLIIIQGGSEGMYEDCLEQALHRCLEIVKDKQNKEK